MNFNILKILLIEDNPGDARLLEEMLKETGIQFKLEGVDTLSAGLNMIRSNLFDVILLDLGLPDSQGLSTLTKLIEIRSHAAVIVLTGLADDATGIGAVKEGAQDYLIKGQINFNQLIRAINYAIERKKIETMLHDSEEKYRVLVESADDAIVLTDMNGKHLFRNQAYYTSLGYDAQISIDSDGRSLVHHDDLPLIKSKMNELLQTGKLTTEYRVRHKDGHWVYRLAKSTIIYDEAHKPKSILAIIRDITERKLAEEEKKKLLANEHKAKAEADAARKLDRMKSMFIASTSHELRTPLNSIIGFTSLLLDGISGELNPDQKEQLSIVYSSGKHLLALINDIIDLSKIDAGKMDLQVSEFHLRQVVDEAILTLSVDIKEKGLNIIQDVEDITMKTDRLRLLQCVINLISNSVKYSENGTIKIISKTIGNKVSISFIDNGIGIKTDDIPKLFAPFVRLQTPLTYSTSSTGLGLYLVKKLAKDFLGGDVEVESEFGKGSKFTINILIELEHKI